MERLVIVSNRVASSLRADEGGLATAMRAALHRRQAMWFGFSGNVTEDEPGPVQIHQEGGLTRVLLDVRREDYEGYYLGFANRVLWPLFHYRVNLAEYDRESWAAYCRVNDLFAERLAAALNPDDVVWIHDYQLIPLGAALRRRGIANRLGFFLHIPFPCPEVLTTLPVHETIARSLFDYDLVGFQTETDLQSFTDYVTREGDGWMTGDGNAHAYGTHVRVGTFPISIDTRAVSSHAVRAAGTGIAARLRDSLSGRQLIIGVDRLDYTKGLTRRLLAFERLLETRPQHHRAVVMLQIAPPSREDVPEYQQIRAELDSVAGRINGRFAEPDMQPVRYLNRRFRQDTLFGFYRSARVGLVTPLRDGMNLVAKEYVASQDHEDPGVLVLSRFAGAVRELDASVIVNPFDTDQVADGLDRALAMPLDERRERHAAMMAQLEEHDVHAWWNSFLGALELVDTGLAPVQPAAATHSAWH
ncbi:MAG TPA: trehalose-6-phosphate synthase [Stellaceae bacterium]|nr:trehalose-6-phosphate synthase [Stellaceae bacterium]